MYYKYRYMTTGDKNTRNILPIDNIHVLIIALMPYRVTHEVKWYQYASCC